MRGEVTYRQAYVSKSSVKPVRTHTHTHTHHFEKNINGCYHLYIVKCLCECTF